MTRDGANESQLAQQRSVIDQASDDYQTTLRATYYVAATKASSLSLYFSAGNWGAMMYSVLSLPSIAAGVGMTDAEAAALKPAYEAFNNATGAAAKQAAAVVLAAEKTKQVCDVIAMAGGATALLQVAEKQGIAFACASVWRRWL